MVVEFSVMLLLNLNTIEAIAFNRRIGKHLNRIEAIGTIAGQGSSQWNPIGIRQVVLVLNLVIEARLRRE